MSDGRDAYWLEPVDDVATALRRLDAGHIVRIASRDTEVTVTLKEDIPSGHKFAVRPLASGLRIRKYGEFIGRLGRDVEAGAWIHLHNLSTCAMRHFAGQDWPEETAARYEVVGTSRAWVGKSPLWDAQTSRLYWVDSCERPSISMVEMRTGRETHWTLKEDICSIALMRYGGLVAAMRSGLAIFDPSTGKLNLLHEPEFSSTDTRIIDGKCDARGRLWLGWRNSRSNLAGGRLSVIDVGLNFRAVRGDVVSPTGYAWSLDGRAMYLSDTRRGLIYTYEFDLETGDVGECRLFADVGSLPGGPDGATTDREGFLWSAQFNGGCLIRYAPDGRMDRIVRLPVSKPTSCAFGGADCDRLFVTTASRGMSEGHLAAEPLAGHTLAVDVGIGGFPPARFQKEFT